MVISKDPNEEAIKKNNQLDNSNPVEESIAAKSNQRQLEILPQTWEQVIDFFNKNDNQVKYDKKDSKLEHSFIKIKDKIYAIKTGGYGDAGDKKVLGEGAFGKVKVVQDQNGNNFAVKIEGRGLRGEDDIELVLMKKLGEFHGEAERKISKIYKEKQADSRLYTVMNLKKGRELRDEVIYKSENKYIYKDIPLETKLHLAIKAAESIQKLHDKRIIHSDIKASNFVADVNGTEVLSVEVIDLGLSKSLPDNENQIQMDKAQGTPFFSAPEISYYDSFRKSFVASTNPTYSYASDIYSLGVMFREELNLKKLGDFCKDTLNKEPGKRPTMSELLDELYEKLEEQPNLNENIKQEIQAYKSKREAMQKEFENSINSAENIDDLERIVSNCPNKNFLKMQGGNVTKQEVIKNIKNIMKKDTDVKNIEWDKYVIPEGSIKNKVIELYSDEVIKLLSRSKEDIKGLYQEKNKNESSNMVGKWMLNKHKEMGGVFFGKKKIRENQINLLAECFEHIKHTGSSNSDFKALNKREQALNLYSVLTKIENDIKAESNTRKSGMQEMIQNQKEALKSQYGGEISLMKDEDVKIRAQYVIDAVDKKRATIDNKNNSQERKSHSKFR